MTSNFEPKVAKYSKSSLLSNFLPQQQFRECASLLLHCVSDAACSSFYKLSDISDWVCIKSH